MIRNRRDAYMTGMNGEYKTDNVKGQSELNNMNGFNGSYESGYVGDYRKSYSGGMDGSTHLGHMDYRNPKNTIHDNIGDNVLGEQIFDNKLYIDSSIRDYSRHPDPFRFVVKFNGIEPRTEMKTVNINGEIYSYDKYLEGDTTVIMDRVFNNINAVIMDALFLPHAIEFKTMQDGSYERSGRHLERMYYKYIVLKIHELCNGRNFSNNKSLGQESFIMKLDDETCINYHRWVPISKHVAYPESRLRTIDRLTIEICNDKGQRLCPKLDDKPHDFFAEYRQLIDKIQDLQKKNDVKTIESLIPKLDSLKHIVNCISPELHITFCSLNAQIQTLPQYRY